MRKPLFMGNWKMNKTAKETEKFIKELKKAAKDIDYADIGICPSFTTLYTAAQEAAKSGRIVIGAQDVYWEEKGAYTSAISPLMLKEFCTYVIIGHSERREFFNETDETVNKKVKAAVSAGLEVILCVGETWEERKSGNAERIVEKQLRHGLNGIGFDKITIAYEPVWAISRGDPNRKAATPEDAQQMHLFIRNTLADIYSRKAAEQIRILYGGSMKPENSEALMAQPDIDGGLIGGASLDVKTFINTIKPKN